MVFPSVPLRPEPAIAPPTHPRVVGRAGAVSLAATQKKVGLNRGKPGNSPGYENSDG